VTLFSIYKRKFIIYLYLAIPAPYSCPRLRFFLSSSFLIWRISEFPFSVNERSENLTRCLSDSTQKLKQFEPIIKFSTCIISNILVKPSLKIETARLQITISTIFSLDPYVNDKIFTLFNDGGTRILPTNFRCISLSISIYPSAQE